MWHYEKMCQLILLTSGIVTYAYATEFVMAWYSNNVYEQHQFFVTRVRGTMAPAFWIMVFCNCVVPLTLYWPKARQSLVWLFICSNFINIGMWFERFNIILQSLSREFIPYSWGDYNFSWIDIGITIGSFGWFFCFLLVFVKFFPSMALTEIKELLEPPLREGGHHHGAHASKAHVVDAKGQGAAAGAPAFSH